MPATHVSPALRRRISDDARMMLRAALSEGDGDFSVGPLGGFEGHADSIEHLSLVERMKNFRGQLRLEVLSRDADPDGAVQLRVTVTSTSYLLRYQVASTGAEVTMLNRNGVATSWITTADGGHIQLGRFLSPIRGDVDDPQTEMIEEMEESKPEVLALLGVLDSLDLLDMLRALETAEEVPSGIYRGAERVYHSTSERCAYVFTFDTHTGYPSTVTQVAATANDDSGARVPLQLTIDGYVRHDDSTIEAPMGIKSDVAILVDSAISCFYEWTLAGRQQLEQIFALLDKDDDGSVSGQDVVDQLIDAGQSIERAQSIAMEMTRLMCDSNDPSEEVPFVPFAGFWIMLLADDLRVSDPNNEHRVLPALQQLFLGSQ